MAGDTEDDRCCFLADAGATRERERQKFGGSYDKVKIEDQLCKLFSDIRIIYVIYY